MNAYQVPLADGGSSASSGCHSGESNLGSTPWVSKGTQTQGIPDAIQAFKLRLNDKARRHSHRTETRAATVASFANMMPSNRRVVGDRLETGVRLHSTASLTLLRILDPDLESRQPRSNCLRPAVSTQCDPRGSTSRLAQIQLQIQIAGCRAENGLPLQMSLRSESEVWRSSTKLIPEPWQSSTR